ncbi:MAG: enoyl-CoA hydratase/isomerase family protein [Xanthomonadales bacterium]|nr:enoyl-CoA hydratase/isomerase family protein [Xanthomonadales bacterium]
MLSLHQHARDIVEIQLARPPVNALNPDLLARLEAAIREAPEKGAAGIVLSGAPGMFSAGLDVPHLMQLDRDALEQAWRGFFRVCQALASSPVPSVAAITGHSPAGGAVLSLFCDYRVMAEGGFKIGLNEVQVGLIVPDCIQHALRRVVGTYPAERLMVAGAMISPDEAARLGMVDELAAVDAVVPRAVAWLDALLTLPRSAMLATRSLARADLVAAVDDPERLDLGQFIDAWFREETQGVLGALVARLKGGR